MVLGHQNRAECRRDHISIIRAEGVKGYHLLCKRALIPFPVYGLV
jgi:hypothetical protein